MTTMPAALATGLKQIRCDEIPVPEPAPGMVLVKTRLASICGSDLHIVYMGWNAYEFPLPYGYPGHEGVGEVVDGGGTEFVPGDLVLTVPNIWESKVFAGYQLVRPQFLLKLPRDVPEAHLLMAQQLGTVVFGCRRLPTLVGKTVAVIGQGSVGLFHDFMLRRVGAHRIIGIEPVAARLSAGRAMGIDEAIDVTGRRATEAVLDLTGGEGADLVIEAVGSVETLNQTLQMVRPLGRVAVFGRQVGEEFVYRSDADGRQHRPPVIVGQGDVGVGHGVLAGFLLLGGDELLVGLRREEALKFAGIAQAHLEEPAAAVRLLVDQLRIVDRLLVHFDQLAADRREEVGDGLHRLYLSHLLVLGNLRAGGGQVEVDDVAELILSVVGDTDLRRAFVGAHPFVLFGVA